MNADLPGDLRLYSWLTGHRALRISQQIRGQDVTSVGRELCGLFRLEMNLRVRQMSRGMRQKLGLVLALAHRPRPDGRPSSMLDETRATLKQLGCKDYPSVFPRPTATGAYLAAVNRQGL